MNIQTPIALSAPCIEPAGPIDALPLNIGTGFKALSFKQQHFHGLMDPLIMVDHFTMTEPTFGAHGHAGMSAVSVLFEDSEGRFNNRDSLGNDIDLFPGDLYWLKAGGGAVHDEKPLPGARTHALQVFVNLPARHKRDAPASLHVPAKEMPVVKGDGHRVRIVLGESNGVTGAQSPALPLTILDGHLEPTGCYTHRLEPDQNMWIYAVRGDVEIRSGDLSRRLPENTAIALCSGLEPKPLEIRSRASGQFVLIQGTPVHENFVQRGPFVMSTAEEVEEVAAAYEAGKLGSID